MNASSKITISEHFYTASLMLIQSFTRTWGKKYGENIKNYRKFFQWTLKYIHIFAIQNSYKMILLDKVSEELGLFSHNILISKTNSLDGYISKVNYTAYNFRVGRI